MNETERELWRVLNDVVFGTRDPELIREKLLAMKAEFELERSTLGRFLRSLRFERELTVIEAARKAGVEPRVWEDWELDRVRPTEAELKGAIEAFWWRRREAFLWELWGRGT